MPGKDDGKRIQGKRIRGKRIESPSFKTQPSLSP